MKHDQWLSTYIEGTAREVDHYTATSELYIGSDDRGTFDRLTSYVTGHPVHSTFVKEVKHHHEKSATLTILENLNFTRELQYLLVNDGWQIIEENESSQRAGGGPWYIFGSYKRANPEWVGAEAVEMELSSADWVPALERLTNLFKSGMLTDKEFEQAKRKLLDT